MKKRKKLLRRERIISFIGLFMIFVGFALWFIAGMIQIILGEGIMSSILLAFGLLSGFIGFCVFLIGCVGVSKVKKCSCRKCGVVYDYDNDISWEVLSEEIKSNSNGASRIAKVHVTCYCSNCGSVKTFYKDFCVATIDKYNGEKYRNLEAMIENYFKSCK